MARSNKSSRKARRRGNNMKLPVALLALAASTAAAGDLTDLNSSDRRARLHGGRRHLSTQQQHQESQQLQQQRRQLQSSMCSCSPTVFHVRLDFSNDCNDDTLKENGGIHATLCQLVDGLPPLASPDGPPLDAPTPTLPLVASTTEPPVATTEPPVELPAPTDPPVFVDDPFLPPRPPSDPAPTPPTDGTTVIPTWSPTVTPPPVNESPGTPDAPGATPTEWPTWSPTATMWPSSSTGANPGNGDPVPTYAPTEKWPTYAPTPEEGDEAEPEPRGGWVDSTAYLKAHQLLHGEGSSNSEKGVSKKQLKKQLKQGLDKHEAHELKKLMRDEDDLGVLEKFAGYLHGMQANSGTAREPSSRPTSSTPWPTDDGTYAPTAGGRRKLEANGGGVVGRWTSVPPNDAFFAEFPELRAMQEEIYRARNAERLTSRAGRRLDHGKRQERKKKTGHHTHGMATTQEAVDTDTIPNQLLTAHFLELDASNDMNVINQDDQYLNVTFPPNDAGDPVTSYTLSFNSISALLDPSKPLEEQMGKVPGGVILILVARTASGEVVRNRLIWQYSMGCSAEESVVVESGDAFGWSVFDKLTPPRAEFCPNAPAPATPSPIAGDVPTSRPPTPDIPSKMPSRPSPPSPPSGPTAPSKPTSPSTKAGKPHKPSSSGGSGSSSKSGKALSMPSGDLLDQFDLDSSSSKAAKPAKYSSDDSGSSSESSSKRSSSSSSSSHHSSSSSHHSSSRRQRNRRAEQRDRSGRYQHQQYKSSEQEEAEKIFGRRISRHREGAHRTRRDKVLFADGDKRLRRRRA
ncbi:hypothetical protein ACHAXT_000084 [Thalassiosira profunda]